MTMIMMTTTTISIVPLNAFPCWFTCGDDDIDNDDDDDDDDDDEVCIFPSQPGSPCGYDNDNDDMMMTTTTTMMTTTTTTTTTTIPIVSIDVYFAPKSQVHPVEMIMITMT